MRRTERRLSLSFLELWVADGHILICICCSLFLPCSFLRSPSSPHLCRMCWQRPRTYYPFYFLRVREVGSREVGGPVRDRDGWEGSWRVAWWAVRGLLVLAFVFVSEFVECLAVVVCVSCAVRCESRVACLAPCAVVIHCSCAVLLVIRVIAHAVCAAPLLSCWLALVAFLWQSCLSVRRRRESLL